MACCLNVSANELMERGDSGDRTLTPAQAAAYIALVGAQLAHAENTFYQHKDGLIDDERNFGSVAFLQYARAVHPGFRAAWRMTESVYGPDFRSFVDEKIREAASFPIIHAGAQWLSLVSSEVQRSDGTEKPQA